MHDPRRRRQGTAACLLALGLSGCAGNGGSAPAPGGHRPAVIVVLVDALRPDHLALYGYSRETSPNLDAWAREATVFPVAYSVSSWTKPAVPSLFTSLYPTQHGVLEGSAHGRGGRLESDVLDDRALTLAEAFRACGYRTAGFVHNAQLRAAFGFDQGFDTYENSNRKAPDLLSRAVAWLGQDRARSSFLYVHLLDVHWPYEPSRAALTSLGLSPDLRPPDGDLPGAVNRGERPLDAGTLELLTDLYDAAIRDTDGALRDFFEALSTLGLPGDAVVLVTSDHGEAFGEHGRLGHGGDLYEEQVRIPFILRLPKRMGRKVNPPPVVSLVDVMPTLLDAAGCRIPSAGRLAGRSLLDASSGDDVLLELRHGRRWIRGLRRGGMKLIAVARPAVDLRDPGSLRELRWEVVGNRDGSDGFHVRRLAFEDSDDRDEELSGVLERLDAGAAKAWVAGFEVDLEDARLLDARRRPAPLASFRPGTVVKVDGLAVSPGVFAAEKLRLRRASRRTKLEGFPEDLRRLPDGSVEATLCGLRLSIEHEDLEDAVAEFLRQPPREPAPPELYDLEADPGERSDLAPRRPGEVRTMQAALDARVRHLREAERLGSRRLSLDEATIEQLRALGYVP